jgi:ABC-type glycerol-3-phosphate transport system permease component
LTAVAVMATIPILVLYIFFQRYFTAGIAASGGNG